MPFLKKKFYDETGLTKTKHYIETGAYMGDGIRDVVDEYENIHSIELADKWYKHNVDQYKSKKNVHIYFGDSKKVLPMLLKDINEPITIFLDAHYSGGTTAYGEEETPLLQELEILRERKYDDIIIIDDCRLIGKSGECGIGINHPIYPVMKYDWTNITDEKIKKLLKNNYVILNNDYKKYSSGSEDQYILYRKK